MNKLKLIAGVLLIFTTGIAAGHFGTVFYFKNKIFKQGPPELHHLIKKKISRELKLTPQQHIEFNKIISQAERDFSAFRQKHHPELEENLNAYFKKINEILTPEQQKKFKQIKKRFKHRFSRPKGFSHRQPFAKHAFIPFDELTGGLNLNHDQINNIQPIIKQFNQDIKNIFKQDRLLYKEDIDRDMHESNDIRLKIRTTKNDMIVAVKPFLNENQFLQVKERIENRGLHHPYSE